MKHALLTASIFILSSCATNTPNKAAETTPRTVQFSAVISGYAYTPPQIDVQFGDHVVLSITNQDSVTHGISLPAFGVQAFVGPGQTQTVEFVANQLGAPETFCSSDHGESLLINVQG